MKKPSPKNIAEARTAAQLSQTAAAHLVGVSLRGWQAWESPPKAKSARQMPHAAWELFLLHTGQHPDYELRKK